jgi:hypothetical protein
MWRVKPLAANLLTLIFWVTRLAARFKRGWFYSPK